ncbi:hypothetical protein EVAR_47459_1 [Eumeta japonica]|uniref:Uncharacterized protein n=1 Tax=Eumeta variegata TaxID=151549 RepID=A0A4C1XA79_EUMVA|nr:hypothetical protein EVAR_47459_1 [Eumeta japonica]
MRWLSRLTISAFTPFGSRTAASVLRAPAPSAGRHAGGGPIAFTEVYFVCSNNLKTPAPTSQNSCPISAVVIDLYRCMGDARFIVRKDKNKRLRAARGAEGGATRATAAPPSRLPGAAPVFGIRGRQRAPRAPSGLSAAACFAESKHAPNKIRARERNVDTSPRLAELPIGVRRLLNRLRTDFAPQQIGRGASRVHVRINPTDKMLIASLSPRAAQSGRIIRNVQTQRPRVIDVVEVAPPPAPPARPTPRRLGDIKNI